MKSIYTLLLLLLVQTRPLAAITGTSPYPFDVVITGKGEESIIFIPGFACSGDVWDDTKKQFPKYTCYTLTMAGFANVKAQPNPSFNTWKEGIANYIKDHHIKKPTIIGHSMGGCLALALASDYPDLVNNVVVVDALPCIAAITNPGFTPASHCPFTDQLLAATDEQFLAMQKAAISRLVADTTKQALIVDWSMKSDRATFASMYCSFTNTDLRQSIASIRCPVYVFLEPYFMNIKSVVEDQYKNATGVHLLYAERGLHFIMFDNTDWYMTHLKNVLDKK